MRIIVVLYLSYTIIRLCSELKSSSLLNYNNAFLVVNCMCAYFLSKKLSNGNYSNFLYIYLYNLYIIFIIEGEGYPIQNRMGIHVYQLRPKRLSWSEFIFGFWR